nr:hypothetical protein [Tanacetum cinerariifolium]
MSTPTFAEKHNLIAFLKKPTESDEFEQIVDFLNANPIKYALTVSPMIYTSCIKQFWTSTKVKTINEDVRLQALVDRKKVIVNEASIRRDLRLDDAEGTACLPNAAIFEELARIGKHKSRRKQRKEIEVSQDEIPTEEHIPTPYHDPLPNSEDRLKLNELMEICTKSSVRVLSLEQIKTNQAAEIEKLKKREDASKHGRIPEIDADEDLSLINETVQDQGRMKDQDMFGFNDLDGDVVVVDVAAGEKEEQSEKVAEKEVITADPVTTAGEVVTTVDVKAKEKGKGIMVEPEKPLKNKDQIALNEEVARKLEAQMKAKMEEKERIAREKDEANIAVIEEWDGVQATIDVDRQLAEQLQSQEKEQLSIEERSKLLDEVIESRRKYFAAKRAEEIKNKPPTKAHQSTYMKNIEGYKKKDFKRKSFDTIKKMFDKVYKRVNTFVDINTEIVEERIKKTQAELTEGSSKRARDEIE